MTDREAWERHMDNAVPPEDTDPPRHDADDEDGWRRY